MSGNQLELFSERRRLLTKKAAASLPSQPARTDETDPLVYLKLFDGRSAFYVMQRDPASGELYGFIVADCGCCSGVEYVADFITESEQAFTDLKRFPKPRRLSAALRADGLSFALDIVGRLP